MAAGINRKEVGAHVEGKTVRFGVYLPGIDRASGFDVQVRLIHGDDQFVPEIPPVERPLSFDPAHPLEHVAEWAMSEVMQQRRTEADDLLMLIHRERLPQVIEDFACRLHHANAVAVAGVFLLAR